MDSVCQTFLLSDDSRVLSRLAVELERTPFALRAFNGLEDLRRAERTPAAVALILDSRHPEWRAALQDAGMSRTSVTVMVLTRTNDSAEKIEALDGGADQALCRWEDFAEMKARLAAMFRRLPVYGTAGSDGAVAPLEFGGWRFAPSARRLKAPSEREAIVSDGIARLLTIFLTTPARYMTLADIQKAMQSRYPDQEKASTSTDWRVRIHRLRQAFQQLEPECEPIRHVRGQGYVFGERL